MDLGTKYVLIATAGHVDHGKTALVRALTGIDTDTLKEERERGMTIDAGFAPLELAPGLLACLVDLPGHHRYVRNMVAGASGVDLALLVVAADDSVMPQTAEHVRILRHLGIEQCVVALTKVDLVDDEIRELAAEEVRDLLRGSPLAASPLIFLSSSTGTGVEELHAGLAAAASAAPVRPGGAVFRMPVLGGFHRPGAGTVVTGLPLAGKVDEGDELELLPVGWQGRVRAIQYHGRSVAHGCAGQCLALNLPGLELPLLERGQVLAPPGRIEPVTIANVSLNLDADAGGPLAHRDPVRLHTGTVLSCGRMHLLEAERLEPGAGTLAQFRAERPLAVAPGDRFVLATYSPVRIIGGGRILGAGDRIRMKNRHRVAQALSAWEAALGDPPAMVRLIVAEAGLRTIGIEEITRRSLLIGEMARTLLDAHAAAGRVVRVATDQFWVDAEALARLDATILDAIRTCHEQHPERLGLELAALRECTGASERLLRYAIRRLADEGTVALEAGHLRMQSHRGSVVAALDDLCDRILGILGEAGASPPPFSSVAKRCGATVDLVRQAVEVLRTRNRTIRLCSEIYVRKDVEEEVHRKVLAYLVRHGSLGVVDIRDLLRTSRRYAYLWLDHFDEVGLTRREGNMRFLRAGIPHS